MGKINEINYLFPVFLVHVILEVVYGVAIGPTSNVTQCGNLSCLHNAKCRTDGHGDQYCMCQTGYAGATCNDDFDECSLGNPCMHRGICSNTIGSYRCNCLHGWFGNIHCDIKDNSTTVRNCTPGWMGEWCQDQCLHDSMCRPTEVCKKRGRGLHCLCAPGWSSRSCSVDIEECTQIHARII
ncbi:neurogenic locus notch homolog protein 2-like [Ruditapes philippinarum]|uniref:neurogenic locus notch homolog protein 2-like n=1 Tax=Ruditapes philippinarum TaxID=129788 RepID=UPI00295B7996|nr:neurogenic locus notch homolog protein 2-like [Ruditapes philippinarum]